MASAQWRDHAGEAGATPKPRSTGVAMSEWASIVPPLYADRTLTTAQIAERLGVSTARVSQIAARLGLPLRGKRRKPPAYGS